MITDDSHPRMIRAHKALLQRLGKVMSNGTKPLTTGLLHEMYEVIKHHRAECRREHDLDFPVLVALVVPRLGIIDFKRADLDIASIRATIVNFVQMNPLVTKEEVVAAFRAAYPDLKPGDVLQQQDSAEQAVTRVDERRERIIEEAEKIVKEQGDEPPTLN